MLTALPTPLMTLSLLLRFFLPCSFRELTHTLSLPSVQRVGDYTLKRTDDSNVVTVKLVDSNAM